MGHAQGSFRTVIENARQSAAWSSDGGLREVSIVAWPVVLSMLSYTAMGFVDTLFVAQLGTAQLAGTALAGVAMILLASGVLGTVRGVNVVAAQATGAGQHDRALAVGWSGVLMAGGVGGLLMFFALAATDIAHLLGGTPEVQGFAATYFAVRCLALPGWFVLTAAGQAFQGLGDTRTPMRVNLLSNALNVVLDAVLVLGVGPVPALGVAGAAWATAISFSVGALLLVWALRRDRGWRRPELSHASSVIRVGAPIGARWLADVGGWALLTAMLSRLGAAEVAATQVVVRIIGVSFLPGHGISEAASIGVGQHVGGRRDAAIWRTFHSALTLSVMVMGSFALVFWLAPEPLLGLFSSDDRVLAIGAGLMAWAAAIQLIDALCMTAMGALGGAGDTRFVMVVSMVGMWTIMVPLGWWLGIVLGYGAVGVWGAMTLEITVRAVACTHRWFSGNWRAHTVV